MRQQMDEIYPPNGCLRQGKIEATNQFFLILGFVFMMLAIILILVQTRTTKFTKFLECHMGSFTKLMIIGPILQKDVPKIEDWLIKKLGLENPYLLFVPISFYLY